MGRCDRPVPINTKGCSLIHLETFPDKVPRVALGLFRDEETAKSSREKSAPFSL